MEDTHYSNDYLSENHIVNNINVNKESNAIFVEFTVINQRSYGCIYTSKKKNCFHCKSCRKLYDKRRYDNKKKRLLTLNLTDKNNDNSSNVVNVPEPEESFSDIPSSREAPSAFRFGAVGIEWYKRTHLPECTLISSYNLFLGSFEKLVVIHRSQFPCPASSFNFKIEPDLENDTFQEWDETSKCF